MTVLLDRRARQRLEDLVAARGSVAIADTIGIQVYALNYALRGRPLPVMWSRPIEFFLAARERRHTQYHRDAPGRRGDARRTSS